MHIDHDHDHSHSHSHGPHGHTHPPEETKAIVNRLAKAIGHLNRVKEMVADNRDCADVLIQLSAVRSALNSTGLLILQSHINHCIVDAVQEGDTASIENLNKAIYKYFK